MSARGTNFLHQWISNIVPDTVGAVSVAELRHKMFEDARAIGIGQGELEEDTGSAYKAIHGQSSIRTKGACRIDA